MSRQWHARPGLERWYVGSAIADGRSSSLRLDQAIHIRDGIVAEIVPVDDAPRVGDCDVEVVDASGATVVPSLVDCHAHVPLQGGARWLERALDPTERLLDVAERSRHALLDSGVRWIRDVGSPMRSDTAEETDRAVSLHVRDRWRAQGSAPHMLVAGTWLTAVGVLPPGLAVESSSGEELRKAALRQIDDGADLVKLYLDGPDKVTAPFTAAEVAAVVKTAHDRGAAVAAHATRPSGIRAAAAAGVDTIEHGSTIDDKTAKIMSDNGVALVSTLSVYRSFCTFSTTTTIPRFRDIAAQRAIYEEAKVSVARAHQAGVRIGAGSDFGGGSVRPGHLAWEAEALVEAGLTPWEALGCLTWVAGDIIGQPAAGRIQVGAPANLLLVHGDPTIDPSALWRVWEVVVSDYLPGHP